LFKELLLSSFTPKQIDQWIDVFAYCVFNRNGGCPDCPACVDGLCQRPKNPFCSALKDCDVCGVSCTADYNFEWFQDLVDKAEQAGVFN